MTRWAGAAAAAAALTMWVGVGIPPMPTPTRVATWAVLTLITRFAFALLDQEPHR